MKCLLILLLATVSTAAVGQEGNPAAMPDPMADPLAAAMIAQAARPGDDALSCEQLQAEIGALGTDPKLQAVIQEQGTYAQEQMGKMQGAQQQAEALNAKEGAEAEKNIQDMMANAEKIQSIMPKIMRGAHVVQLAKTKGCDPMAEAAPSP